jgi:DNA polymerase-3 subunit delta'
MQSVSFPTRERAEPPLDTRGVRPTARSAATSVHRERRVTSQPTFTPFTFDRIRGQGRAIGLLTDAVRANRLSQAYLFHGPWGVGKTTTALALAAALNCEGPYDAARPCGACLPCRKVARFNHPDVRILLPLYPASLWKEPAGKGTVDEPAMSPVGALLAEWAQSPFHVFRWAKRPSIATEWVLEAKREATRKTFEGRTKVIIFSGVETMGVEASNRILKMLEEPGPHTVFVLTTSRLHQVLPTIRSRCQRLAFGELPLATIEETLTAELGVEGENAAQLAALSRGSLARAVLLLDEGIAEIRRWALRIATLEGDALIARLSADVLGDSRRWDGRTVRHVAEVLMTWYRDVLGLKHGAEPDRIVNRDARKALDGQADRLSVEAIGRRVKRLEALVQAVENQVTPAHALFAALAGSPVAFEAPRR